MDRLPLILLLATVVQFHAVSCIGFRARMSSNRAYNAGAYFIYDVVDFDDNGGIVNSGFDTKTGTFTCPLGGIYQINSQIGFYHYSYFRASVVRDGSAMMYHYLTGYSSRNNIDSASTVIHCSKGQKLRVYMNYCSSYCSRFYGGDYTIFSGYLLHAD